MPTKKLSLLNNLKKKIVSSCSNTVYTIIENKDNLTKKSYNKTSVKGEWVNGKIKQVLKESRYQKNIAGKNFNEITNHHS